MLPKLVIVGTYREVDAVDAVSLRLWVALAVADELRVRRLLADVGDDLTHGSPSSLLDVRIDPQLVINVARRVEHILDCSRPFVCE